MTDDCIKIGHYEHYCYFKNVYRHKSGLTGIDWNVSKTYMILNTKLTNKGLVTCVAI